MKNKIFGYDFACALDQHFQRFLSKCMEAEIISDVDVSFFDMSFMTQSAIYSRVSCDLPASFSEATTSSSSKHARKYSPSANADYHRHAKSNNTHF